MSAPLPRVSLVRLRYGVSVLTAAGLLCASLGGCAGGFSTQASRIGEDDGMDSCRRQLVALDSTGNFFAEDILKGAALGAVGGALVGGLAGRSWRDALIGGAAGAAFGAAAGYWATLRQQGRNQAELTSRVRRDLARENAEIGRTQVAFDMLADCRFRQAQAIRTAYTAGQMPRDAAAVRMDQVRAQARRDVQLARLIDRKITERGEQFEIAADNLSPGTRQAIEAARSTPPRVAVVRSAASVTLRPTPASPDLANLRAQERVRVVSTRGAYAVVETDGGDRGYAPVSALDGADEGRAEAPAAGDPVRTLAGSNAARRDDFTASVAVTEQAAARQFELGG